MSTSRALLADGVRRLRVADIEDAPREARLLLARVLGVEPATLLLALDHPVPPAVAVAFEALLARRLAREPLFYILGEREFYGLSLRVDRRALIPRPETELLVEEALAVARTYPLDAALHIADVGTGSGCIAVALAVHLPLARLYALDISGEALDLARANAVRHGVEERVTFLRSDLLASLPELVEIIVSNPPYVPAASLPDLPPEIGVYEPRVAVDGGAEGTVTAYRLLAQAPAHLRPGGALLMEIGYGQAWGAVAVAQSAFPNARIEVVPDLAGIPRVLRARLRAGEVGSATDAHVGQWQRKP
ncbi:MAG: peptide chain release factor N(5)-glutamine methyltransferase [Chloroflexi bacterium]|nr:peptide chain release factor N(5)-glutamine methyltransferase [Chloroflexota bacterium]